MNWNNISNKVRSIAIVGNPESGKTSLSYHILESFNNGVYVYRHPNMEIIKERGFYPLNSLERLEGIGNCVLWIDEPQLHFPVGQNKANHKLTKGLSIGRHRNITIILTTNDTRWITRGMESYIDVWCVKDLEYELIKQGSMIKKIIKDNTIIDPCGFCLEQNEYLFHSRNFNEYNGRHTFNMPLYFNEDYSKPFSLKTTTKTPTKSAKLIAIER